MTRVLKDIKELGRDVAGADCLFYADTAQDFAAVHVGFFKNGKTVTETISLAQAATDPNLEDFLEKLKEKLDE